MACTVIGVESRKRTSAIVHGLTLDEVVKPVEGFLVTKHSSSQIQVRNLTIGKMENGVTTSSTNFVFQLLDGEFVIRVDYTEHDKCLRSIRFHTNWRTSQWIGEYFADDSLKTLASPCDHAIHSLCGTSCRLVGAVLWPKGEEVLTLSTPYSYEEHLFFSGTLKGRSWFGRNAKDLAAIVITMSGLDLMRLQVLSRMEYKRYVEMMHIIDLTSGEHLVELVEDENVRSVAYAHTNDRVQAIQFTTTHRTTPWFGKYKSFPITTVRAPSNTPIVGLVGRNDWIGVATLGFLIARPLDGDSIEPISVVKETVLPDKVARKDAMEAWELVSDRLTLLAHEGGSATLHDLFDLD